MERDLKQSERNILGQIANRGYSICGHHYGQSIVTGEDLIRRGLAVGSVHHGDLYLNLTDAGRAALAKATA
jgi:hypothetical protein